MTRRDFLRAMALATIGGGITPNIFAQSLEVRRPVLQENLDDNIKDYLHKMKNFNLPHKDDIKLNTEEYPIFQSALMRLKRLELYAGHGNFQFLGFDEGLRIARNVSSVGEFSEAELRFLERIFHEEAARYGFFGEKPLSKLTNQIKEDDVVKVPYSGNYLYKGLPLDTFNKIKQQLGEQAVLTSGVRGIMKQFSLFLIKAYQNDGNLSLASRSLAPPGYSFHGIGDFDVGQVGFGDANFTELFTTTPVYKRLSEIGYLSLRYPQENLLGVRFEPWHVKITT
jgi:hypothetical protein